MMDERTQDQQESEEHARRNGGAMNSDDHSQDILPIVNSLTRFMCRDYTAVEPIASPITRFKNCVDYTAVEQCSFARDTSGIVQQVNTIIVDCNVTPSDEDEDVQPNIGCQDCTRVGLKHWVLLPSPGSVTRFKNRVEKFMQHTLDLNTSSRVQKINRNSDVEGDGTPSANCPNGVKNGAVGRWDIDLPCPECRRAALLDSVYFEDEHCALKWIDFGVPVNAKDWELRSDILNECRKRASYRIAALFLEAAVARLHSDHNRNRFLQLDLPCPRCSHAALVKSISLRHYFCTKQWIELGVTVNSKNYEDEIAVLAAANFDSTQQAESVELVKLLISGGVDVNTYDDSDGITALHIAADQGNSDVVTLLLEAGANINNADKNGDTAVSYACKYAEDEKCLLVCLAAGGNPNTVNNFEMSPLDIAFDGHQERVAECLVLSGATKGITGKELELRPQITKAINKRHELKLSLLYICRSHITKHLMHIHNNHSNMFALVRKLELPEGLRRILICEDYYLPDKDTLPYRNPEHLYSRESESDD